MANALSDRERALMDAYWRAANYLSVGQIYLYDNPLLSEPLSQGTHQAAAAGPLGNDAGSELHLRSPEPAHQEARPRHDLHRRPGHGGPGLVANAYLEGTYSEVYPNISADEDGMKRLFKQFSFPGGIPSHVAPETPGSIHEGGELGYALSHAYGAAFDNPDLIVACVVGDGEAETGRAGDELAFQQVPQSRCATAWCCRSCISTATRSPIPPFSPGSATRSWTISSRGYGYTPYFVEGRRAAEDARADGRHARHRHRRDPAHQGTGARRRCRTSALAHDRDAHAQRLDLSQGDRRPGDRGLLARPSGADERHAESPSTCGFSSSG